jgi:hypothetical protein
MSKQPGTTGTYLEDFTDPASGNVELFHFAPHGTGEPFTTDPGHFGKSPWSAAERKAEGTPKTFFYTDLADKEHFFAGRPLFRAEYPAGHIYDATRDPDSHAERARSVTDLIAKLRNLGYHGIFYSGAFPTVAMWKPVEMKRHQEPEKPRQLARPRKPKPKPETVPEEHDRLHEALAGANQPTFGVTTVGFPGGHDHAAEDKAVEDFAHFHNRHNHPYARVMSLAALRGTEAADGLATELLQAGGKYHAAGSEGASFNDAETSPVRRSTAFYTTQAASAPGVKRGIIRLTLGKGNSHNYPFVRAVVHSRREARHVLKTIAPDIAQKAMGGLSHLPEESPNDLLSAAEGTDWRPNESIPEDFYTLARMKAPAKGAIVNNQYAKGGQFLPKAFARIRDVARRLVGTEPMRLARPRTVSEDRAAADKAVHSFLAQPDPPHAGFYRLLDNLGLTPVAEGRSLTKRELLAVENATNLPPNLRLSRYGSVAALADHEPLDKAGLRISPVLRFLNDLAARHLSGRRLRSVLANRRLSPEVRALFHSVSVLDEARRFLHHAGGDPDASAAHWYTTAMNPLDVAYHTLFAENHHDPLWGSVDWRHKNGPRLRYDGRPVWDHAPAQTMARAVTALLSGQRDPRDNTDIAARLIGEAINAAKAKGHGNWVMEIPEAQHEALAKWKSAYGQSDPMDGGNWEKRLLWSKGLPAGSNAQGVRGFKSTGVYAVPDASKEGGFRVLGIVTVGKKGKPRIFPGEEKAFAAAARAKTLEEYDGVPLTDREGRLVPKSWSSLAAVPQNLRTLKRVMLRAQDLAARHGKPGDVRTAFRIAAHWLLSEHDPKSLNDVVNDDRIDGPELYGADANVEDPRSEEVEEGQEPQTGPTRKYREVKPGYIKSGTSMPGSWVFGPKFGPFMQNIHGNTPVPKGKPADYWTRWLTPDVWWTRGWRLRQAGLDVGGGEKGKIKGDQPTQGERGAMLKAAQIAAEKAKGTPLDTVAALQAADWFATQHLPRLLGVPVDSFSFVHGANHVLSKAGKSHIVFDPSGRLSADSFAEPHAEGSENEPRPKPPAPLKVKLERPGGLAGVVAQVASNPVIVALAEALAAIYAPQFARLGQVRLARPEAEYATEAKAEAQPEVNLNERWGYYEGDDPHLPTVTLHRFVPRQSGNTWVWRRDPGVRQPVHVSRLAPGGAWEHAVDLYNHPLHEVPLTPHERQAAGIDDPSEQDWRPREATPEDFYALARAKLSRAMQPVQPMHHVYVSPSTDENTTYQDAVRQLGSFQLRELQAAADRLPGVMGGQNGVGFWADGAEASRAIAVHDPALLPVVAATLGKQFRQKSVLWFQDDPEGPDTLHVLTVPTGNAEQVHRELMRHGVEYKTVLPGSHRDESVVHVADGGSGVAPSVEAFANESHATTHFTRKGRVSFAGAEDRESAGRVFDEILSRHVTTGPASVR